MSKYTRICFSCFFFLFFCLSGSVLQAKDLSFYASQSKLSEGKWVKLQVSGDAVYRLTYEDIQAMGIDPSKASIHGYGGWILNEDFSQNDYADDLPEVPVWISGGDNKLDPGEFLLFYGKGTVKWTYNSSKKEFTHENNPYANHGYYFITDATGAPSIISKATAEASGNTTVTTFDDYAVHERDMHVVITSGRQFFGENFRTNTSQNFRFNIEGIVNESAKASVRFISTATTSGVTVKASINGASASGTFLDVSTSEYMRGSASEISWQWQPNGSGTVETQVTFSHSGYNAYLDYIRLNMKRELKPYGSYTFFRKALSKTGNYTYEVANASANMLVWEISPLKSIQQVHSSVTNGKLIFHARETSSSVREYVLIDPGKSFPKPETVGAVSNQNLHGLQEGIDMIVITRPIYWQAAQELANKHKEVSDLNVTLVDADHIYNEFSSGTPDATAYRRFMKMLYDRGKSNNTAPQYLLLFGDASHDNRLITEAWKNHKASSLLLSYQSENSLMHDNLSYVTDDYFGYLGDSSNAIGGTMQLGIGRLPVNSAYEAQIVVNKIMNFMENKNSGIWKNKAIFIGGDENKKTTPQYEHIETSDELARDLVKYRPEMFASTVYYNSFQRVYVGGAPTFPGAIEKLNNKLKEGAILLNFLGHGDPLKIDKNVINTASINQMKHSNTPVWILGTCEFSRFDDLNTSAGELALLNATSGAIATISAARVVLITGNEALNKQLIKFMFNKDENGKWPRLGDVVRKGKNALGSGTNKLSYTLLGDPALSLSLPELSVHLETINGTEANSPGIQFRAEETMVLKGKIINGSGEVEEGFNGNIQTILTDCINHLETYDYRGDSTFKYNEYLNTLYRGTSSVVNGEFMVRVPIPREISFKNEPGKLSFYAISNNQTGEASGYFTNFVVGGSVDRPDSVIIGAPKISNIYLNSANFIHHHVVNESPYFVAEVYDSIGINRSGVGIGHHISLVIDNKKMYSYNLNDYYEESEENPGHGTIRFMIPDSLPAGQHSLTFRVWNIMNKSATQTLDFMVEPGKAPVIYDLTVSENPAKTDVYFVFKHDRPEAQVKVTIGVFDLTGSPVWSHESIGHTDELATTPVYWDLTSNGRRIKPGVYLYRASISGKFGKESTASKKLIILAQ